MLREAWGPCLIAISTLTAHLAAQVRRADQMQVAPPYDQEATDKGPTSWHRVAAAHEPKDEDDYDNAVYYYHDRAFNSCDGCTDGCELPCKHCDVYFCGYCDPGPCLLDETGDPTPLPEVDGRTAEAAGFDAYVRRHVAAMEVRRDF